MNIFIVIEDGFEHYKLHTPFVSEIHAHNYIKNQPLYKQHLLIVKELELDMKKQKPLSQRYNEHVTRRVREMRERQRGSPLHSKSY